MPISEETRRKLSELSMGRVFSPETRAKLSVALKGKPKSDEARKNMSLAHRGLLAKANTKKRMSASHKGKQFSSTHKDNLSRAKREDALRLWQSPEYVQKQMKARGVAPNRKELLLAGLLNEWFPKTFKFVGDGQFILAGKCPDFVNTNGKKQVIELYGNYWHEPEEEKIRKDYFSQFGYDTLIIWEKELTDMEKLRKRLTSFVGGAQCQE